MRIRRTPLPGKRGLAGTIFWTDRETGSHFSVEVDPEGFEGLAFQHDVSPAAWVANALWDSTTLWTIGALLPELFEAYVRVDYRPSILGDAHDHARLFGLLAEHTETPGDAWFCLWDGYGVFGRLADGKAIVDMPPGVGIRKYFLYRGPLRAWDAMSPSPLHHVPDLVWPEDRSWFLGTDTDLDWGYLGGTERCISALEGDGTLGVSRVERHHPLVSPGGLET